MARPLSFDPEDKLNIAMLVFWKNGYSETSISMLLDAMSISRYSLYQQFGNKEALFIQVLDHYYQEVYSKTISPLESQDKGKTAIDEYLQRFSAQLISTKAQHGCLIVNTLLAGNVLPEPLRDIAKQFSLKLYVLLKENFQAAKSNGELQTDIDSCVRFTLMTIEALLNTRKSQGLKASQANIAFFREAIKKW